MHMEARKKIWNSVYIMAELIANVSSASENEVDKFGKIAYKLISHLLPTN